MSGSTLTLQRKNTWGLDLAGVHGGSGVLDSAGGIGGLLATLDTQGTTATTDDKKYVYFYDANGNVGQAVDTATTTSVTIAARYEYDAYGVNVLDAANLAQSGPYAAKNPFRFSTKWFDDETTLGYWGYRYYLPSIGRWVSRDPIGERGGSNLYAASLNLPTGVVDPDGASPSPCSPVPAGTPLLPTGAMGRPIWNLKPPGDCTKARHDELYKLVIDWCHSDSFKAREPYKRCPTREYCEDMADRMVKNQNCINARRQINFECYRGGNAGHQIAEYLARVAKEKLDYNFDKYCFKDRSPKPRPQVYRAPVNALNPPTDATPSLFLCPLPHPAFVLPFTIWELLFGGACGVVIAEEALA